MARRQRIQNRRRAHSSWPSIAMPAAEFSLVTEWDISSRRSSASVKAAYSLQYSSTFIMERNTQETIHDHITSISIGSRPVENIDLMVGSNTELQDLANKVVESASEYGMEYSTQGSPEQWWITQAIPLAAPAKHWRKCYGSTTWEETCQKMAPATLRSAHGSPQQGRPDWKGYGRVKSPSSPSSSSTNRWSYASTPTGVIYGDFLLGQEKGCGRSKTKVWESSSESPTVRSKDKSHVG